MDSVDGPEFAIGDGDMTFPVMFSIGSFSVSAHAVFEALAYVAGFQVFRRLHRRLGDIVDVGTRLTLLTAAAIGAVLGSKLLHVLESPQETFSSWQAALGGKTIVGGLYGGWIAVEIAKKRLGVVDRTGDIWAVPMAVGVAVGRIGCFLGGTADHTAGRPTDLFLGFDFGDGIPRHATQLYEIFFLASLVPLLYERTVKSGGDGTAFRLFILLYSIWRLGVDFLKPVHAYPWGLSAIQTAALLVAIFTARSLARPLPLRSLETPT